MGLIVFDSWLELMCMHVYLARRINRNARSISKVNFSTGNVFMNFSNFSRQLALGVIVGLGVHTTASATPVSLVDVVDISDTDYGDFVITVNSEFSGNDIQLELTNNLQTGIVSYSAYALLSEGLQTPIQSGALTFTFITPVNSLSIVTGTGDDTVSVSMGNELLSGYIRDSISIDSKSGEDSISISGVYANGGLSIRTRNGADDVNLTRVVSGKAFVGMGPGSLDALVIQNSTFFGSAKFHGGGGGLDYFSGAENTYSSAPIVRKFEVIQD